MHVRIEIPIDDLLKTVSWDNERGMTPGSYSAKLAELIREFMEVSRLGTILRTHGVKYKILDQYVFAVLTDEIYVEIMMAFNYNLNIFKQNNADKFSVL